MHIGVVCSDSPQWPKMLWCCEALRHLGHSVSVARTRPQLERLDAECDFVLWQHKSPIRWPNVRDLAGRKRAPWVQWWFDLINRDPARPFEFQTLFRKFRPLMRAMDLVFVKEPVPQLDDIRFCYLDQACPRDYPAIQRDQEIKWDVLLWGQGGNLYRQRTQDATRLAEAGFRVAWAGNRNTPRGIERLPWTDPVELPRLAGQARCVLSVGRRHGLTGYWSDGLWLAMGMGAPVLRLWTAGIDEQNGPGSRCYCYRDVRECFEVIQSLQGLERPVRREEQRRWVLQNHSYHNRFQSLIEHVRSVAGTAAARA